MISDESLLLQYQGGSREAFEELFERYRQPLYAFFRRRLNNAARAEELTQETFLAVIRGRGRYEPKSLVRTYLYGIGLKLISAERRYQSRHKGEARSGLIPASTDAAIWVRQGLERLDEMDREILMLREFDELSYAQIADLLHLPLNTVRSRLFRGRMALKEVLTPGETAGESCK